MMKPWLTVLISATLVLGLLVALAGDVVKGWVIQALTDDMFVAVANDAFDPGLSVGSQFPKIDARLGALPVTDISLLVGDRGLIFIASRSVDW